MREMKIDIKKALRAGYTYFYCPTYEMDRTVKLLINSIKEIETSEWSYNVWDFEEDNGDPDKVLELLSGSDPYTAVIAKNFNWFIDLKSQEVNYNGIQFIQNHFEEFSARQTRKALIIVSDEAFDKAIPPSLQKDFIVLNFDLPGYEEVKEVLNQTIEAMAGNDKFKKPTKKETEELVESALGLTKRSCSNAFAYSIIETDGKLDPKIVANMRAAEINETPGLTVGNYDVDEVLGYDVAKDFIRKAIRNPNSRGVLLLGPPGVGKTHLAKWASTVSSKIMIEFELAGVQGEGLYGQAEAAMGKSISVVKAIRNCLLFIDEIEKAIPGKEATNDTTGTRSFGQLLKFLSDDRPPGTFVIATCNNIQKLPPEWYRSGRFDVIFFSDLPDENAKAAIYEHYLNKYKVETGGFTVPKMKDWTGSEIESVCRLASVLETNADGARKYITPIAATSKEDIEYLRKWAVNRSIPASKQEPRRIQSRQIDI